MRLLVKPITLIVVCLAILIGCETEKEVIDLEQLQSRQGIFYEVNSAEPYTGTVVIGMKTAKNEWKDFVDGKREGQYQWHENGQKQLEGNIVDGKQKVWLPSGMRAVKNGPKTFCRW